MSVSVPYVAPRDACIGRTVLLPVTLAEEETHWPLRVLLPSGEAVDVSAEQYAKAPLVPQRQARQVRLHHQCLSQSTSTLEEDECGPIRPGPWPAFPRSVEAALAHTALEGATVARTVAALLQAITELPALAPRLKDLRRPQLAELYHHYADTFTDTARFLLTVCILPGLNEHRHAVATRAVSDAFGGGSSASFADPDGEQVPAGTWLHRWLAAEEQWLVLVGMLAPPMDLAAHTRAAPVDGFCLTLARLHRRVLYGCIRATLDAVPWARLYATTSLGWWTREWVQWLPPPVVRIADIDATAPTWRHLGCTRGFWAAEQWAAAHRQADEQGKQRAADEAGGKWVTPQPEQRRARYARIHSKIGSLSVLFQDRERLAVPPCMRDVMERAHATHDLTYKEKWAMAGWLVEMGFPQAAGVTDRAMALFALGDDAERTAPATVAKTADIVHAVRTSADGDGGSKSLGCKTIIDRTRAAPQARDGVRCPYAVSPVGQASVAGCQSQCASACMGGATAAGSIRHPLDPILWASLQW